MRQIILIGLVVSLFLSQPLWPQQELKKVGGVYQSKLTHKFKVEPGGLLLVSSVSGDVKVASWNKDIVEIWESCKLDVFTVTEAREILKRIQTSYQKHGNTIRLKRKSRSGQGVHSTFKITVPHSFNIEIDTHGGDVRILDIKGTVDAKTTGGDVNLTQIDGDVIASSAGGSIRLKSCSGEAKLSTAGGDIELDRVTGPVKANTAGGDIEAHNVKNNIVAKTAGGDIELKIINGNVTAQTAGGSINAEDVAGSIEAKTAGGDIELELIRGNATAKTSAGDIEAEEIHGGIEAATSGGDITLADIRGYIEARTSAGNIEAKMTLKDFSQDHHVTMKTSAGNLVLYLPEKLPATIEAIIHQSRRWSDYSISSDFPLSYSDEDDDRHEREARSRIMSQGDINGGGDLIKLETWDGDIRIKKLR